MRHNFPKGGREERGYGRDWIRARKIALKRDGYLCQPCLADGFVTNATQVDHIRPKAKGGTDALNNLQSICDACAKVKNAIDSGRPLVDRLPVAKDGWQIWDPKAH